MRWVPLAKAKSLEMVAPLVPDAAGTFTVSDVSGGELQASTAAGYVALNTTLAAAAAAGARTLTVTSTVGFVAGRSYLLGGPEATGGEFVLVGRVVNGTTLTLVRALRSARAIGDTIASTRVTFPIAAGTSATCGRNLRIEWTWESGGVAQDPVVLPFDVTRYAPVTFCNTESVRTLDPLVSKRIADGTYMPALLDTSWTMLLRRVAAKVAPGGVAGTVDLTIPHGYLTLVLLLEPGAGDTETDAHIARLETRFTQELDAALAALAIDSDQDGDGKTGEAGWGRRTITLIRN